MLTRANVITCPTQYERKDSWNLAERTYNIMAVWSPYATGILRAVSSLHCTLRLILCSIVAEKDLRRTNLRQRTRLYIGVYVRDSIRGGRPTSSDVLNINVRRKLPTESLPRSLIKTSFTMKDVVPLLWDGKITICIHRAIIIIVPNCFTFNLAHSTSLCVPVRVRNIYTKTEKKLICAGFIPGNSLMCNIK